MLTKKSADNFPQMKKQIPVIKNLHYEDLIVIYSRDISEYLYISYGLFKFYFILHLVQ